MWRQERPSNSSNTRRILVLAQVASVSIVMMSLAVYMWKNTGIGNLDPTLQVAAAGIFCVVVVLIASYLYDRRW